MKSVFDMTQKELDVLLQPVTEAAISKRFEKGLPVAYQDERCPSDLHFIYEYKDGSQFLVLQHQNELSETVIKRLV